MFCALLMSRYQVSVYRTNGPLVSSLNLYNLSHVMKTCFLHIYVKTKAKSS